MSNQLRNFVFTKNNPCGAGYVFTNREEPKFLEAVAKMEQVRGLLPIKYMTYGVEHGKSKTLHFQGYIELEKRVSFNIIKRHLPGCHIEPRMGSQQQAIEYCRKEGIFYEYGSPKTQGDRSDLRGLQRMLESDISIKRLLNNPDIEITPQSLRTAERLIRYVDKPRTEEPEVLWFYGATGAGKTRKAMELLPDAYFKTNGSGKWWPSYDGETDVIIDDVRSANYWFIEMLGLLDRYSYTVEDKGLVRQFKGTRIILTSTQHPRDLYRSSFLTGEDMEQLMRRITLVVEFVEDDSQ